MLRVSVRSGRLRRRRLPGPAPAGGPISYTDKKWGKEAAGGLGGLPGLRPERATRDGRSRALRPATPA